MPSTVWNSEGLATPRRINRAVQGAIGEASAIEWFSSKGAVVWVPLGPSPHVDLIAEFEGALRRVQAKTSTCWRPRGSAGRWEVSLRTRGGNQSWSGTSKRFESQAVDYLFVLVGDGRRWVIPASVVEGTAVIKLGGAKYAEFEVECGTPLGEAVYRSEAQ